MAGTKPPWVEGWGARGGGRRQERCYLPRIKSCQLCCECVHLTTFARFTCWCSDARPTDLSVDLRIFGLVYGYTDFSLKSTDFCSISSPDPNNCILFKINKILRKTKRNSTKKSSPVPCAVRPAFRSMLFCL